MAPYFMENLDKIRHTVVKLSPVSADALGQQQKFEEKDGIITSNRLDSMIACVYKFSRSQALEFFKAEKVFVNGKCVQNHPIAVRKQILSRCVVMAVLFLSGRWAKQTKEE